MGRILSVILGFYGIVVVALITSIIVNFYRLQRMHDMAGFNAKATNGGNKPFAGRRISDLHLIYTF